MNKIDFDILSIKTIKTEPYTPTDVDSVQTQVNSNDFTLYGCPSLAKIKELVQDFEFKFEIKDNSCKSGWIFFFTKSEFRVVFGIPDWKYMNGQDRENWHEC